jgi:hypothetical protein
MAVHIEVSIVEYPFKLCELCKDALGSLRITFEPGDKRTAETFSCSSCFPQQMYFIGEGINALREQEKGNG